MEEEKKSTIGLTIISLSAIPILYLLKFLTQMENGEILLVIGVFLCFIIVPLFFKIFVLNKLNNYKGDYFLYVFTVFAFTSVVDLILSFTILGYNDWMGYYLRYFKH
jgi:hypothetical protein